MACKPSPWSPYRKQMEEFERRLLQSTWDLGKSISRVASLLGVTREFARKRLEALGIRPVPKTRPRARTNAQVRALERAREVNALQRETLREQDAIRIATATSPVEPKVAPAEPETTPIPENGSSESPGGST